MKRTCGVLLFGLFLLARPAGAATILLENFEAAFPAWESGFLGTNSNVENYYVSAGNPNTFRGNNPDGLWIDDGNLANGDDVEILFNPAFGAGLTHFAIDVAGYVNGTFTVFDSLSNVLLSAGIFVTNGATTNPGTYGHYDVVSLTGIGGFSFTSAGDSIAGNTSIDNVSVTVGDATPVPEPSSLALLGLGLGGLMRRMRRRQVSR